MISVKTNIGQVIGRITLKLSALADKDKMLRTCAVGILPVIKTRIHEEGKDANDSQIGTYSPGYMKVRTGDFGNSKRSRKGELKDSGNQTKRRVNTPFGKSKFAFQNIESDNVARKRYNRSGDTKVVASLTRQMENDFKVIPTDIGYGLGYSNPENRKKADYVENTYKKEIFKTTEAENKLILQIAKDYIASI